MSANGCGMTVVVRAPLTPEGRDMLGNVPGTIKNLGKHLEFVEWMREPEHREWRMEWLEALIASIRDLVSKDNILTFELFDQFSRGLPNHFPIEVLSSPFPELLFEVDWAEGSCQFGGKFSYKGGRVLDSTYGELGGANPFDSTKDLADPGDVHNNPESRMQVQTKT